MTRFAFVLSLAFAAALAACAAAGRKAQQPEMTQPRTDASIDPTLSGRPDVMRERIRVLDEQIARELDEARIEAPDAEASAAMSATPIAEARVTCDHVPSDRCQDVCKLSGSICDNAAAICELADELPGDAWAAERCGAAKASCRRATERCCAGECAATR